MNKMARKVGFIGQGWIGKNYADDFEKRGYTVIRYGLEEDYKHNKEAIKDCTTVFIAVPTPTTPAGFDYSIVEEAVGIVGPGTIVVIKSTLAVGTTVSLQQKFKDIYVLHSPEFLVEKTAAYDAAHPNRNIIGIPKETACYREVAEQVLSVLPDAPYQKVMLSTDAELVKYAGNCFLYTKVLFMNLLFDLVENSGGDWVSIREALIHDPRIGISHTEPVSSSRTGAKPGRGAGGHCFIKDFETFRKMYKEHVGDTAGKAVLTALAEKNIDLLLDSEKDLDLLRGVYGEQI